MSFRNQARYKKQKINSTPLDLKAKVSLSGGQTGLALESPSIHEQRSVGYSLGVGDNSISSGIYGNRSTAKATVPSRSRKFHTTLSRQSTSISRQASASVTSKFSYRSRFSGLYKNSTSTWQVGNSNVAVHVVCAISENLARETCVSSLDAGSPISLQVTKQGNGQTYAETLAYLEILKPNEILLNEGRRNSHLARKIMQLFNKGDPGMAPETTDHEVPNRKTVLEKGKQPETEGRYGSVTTSTVVTFVSRALFDQTKGAELIRRIARDDSFDSTLLEEYILLSSAHAVLQYTQHTLGATFAKKSISLVVNAGGNNRMAIDRSTLLQLELLVNSKTGKVKNSLIGSIGCTKTVVGSRLLRMNLMSPPLSTNTINTRLELVDLFLSDEEFFYTVLDHLNSVPDVDKMLSNIAVIPRKKQNTEGNVYVDERMASKGISALVCIKTTLQRLPCFVDSLQIKLKNEPGMKSTNETGESDRETVVTDGSSLLVGLGGGHSVNVSQQHLLRAIIFAMSQPSLKEVLEAVDDVFTETTTYTRNPNAMRHQECFALKCAEDGMMSIIRKAFLANVDDIYKKADEYAEVYGFHVGVKYSTARGYYLAIPSSVVTHLPQVFLQPVKNGRFLHCSTEEITSLNSRAQDNVNDLLLMTHDRIHEVLDIARTKYDVIASLCDAIALLDMCHSFADNVTLSKLPWCRPIVTDTHEGYAQTKADRNYKAEDEPTASLTIKNGRYAIEVDSLGLTNPDGPCGYIPNDTYAADGKQYTIITGINGSGKTTYLKQIAIITILAHCGSYVPAEAASIPVRDRVCCRIGNADDQEHNISTFMLEMKETAFICRNATNRSLILMDELGRATSNEDGVAIAWSVSEYLLKKRAMTFFVTHYPQVAKLADIYPMVQNVSLKSHVKHGENSEINYTHKVEAGACCISTNYGVEMAAACGWPEEIVKDAREVEEVVTKLLPYDALCHPELLESTATKTSAHDLLLTILGKLKSLVNAERTQSFDSIRSELSSWQQEVLTATDEATLVAVQQLLHTNSSRSNDCASTLPSFRQNSVDPNSMQRPSEFGNGSVHTKEYPGRGDVQQHENESDSDSDGESSLSSSSLSNDELSLDDLD